MDERDQKAREQEMLDQIDWIIQREEMEKEICHQMLEEVNEEHNTIIDAKIEVIVNVIGLLNSGRYGNRDYFHLFIEYLREALIELEKEKV